MPEKSENIPDKQADQKLAPKTPRKKAGRPKGSTSKKKTTKKKTSRKKPGPKSNITLEKKELFESCKNSKKIIQLRNPNELDEEQKIQELFRNSRLRRYQALFREMEYGKGISSIQAAAEIAKIEREIHEEDADQEIEIVWDVIQTDDAAETA